MLTGQVEEMYGGHTIVKAFNGEEEAIKEFEKANDTLYHSAWKSQFLSRINSSSHEFCRKCRVCSSCNFTEDILPSKEELRLEIFNPLFNTINNLPSQLTKLHKCRVCYNRW